MSDDLIRLEQKLDQLSAKARDSAPREVPDSDLFMLVNFAVIGAAIASDGDAGRRIAALMIAAMNSSSAGEASKEMAITTIKIIEDRYQDHLPFRIGGGA